MYAVVDMLFVWFTVQIREGEGGGEFVNFWEIQPSEILSAISLLF